MPIGGSGRTSTSIQKVGATYLTVALEMVRAVANQNVKGSHVGRAPLLISTVDRSPVGIAGDVAQRLADGGNLLGRYRQTLPGALLYQAGLVRLIRSAFSQ
eukprot:276281-Pyramimonas_sp.AAC.1